jgi:RNA polymerase sigma factor (sigma-70 family)
MAVSPGQTLDQAAFEQLYRLHSRSVYGFVRSKLDNPDDAEDVTQTTFLNAYRACTHGRYPQHAESWLIAIARNECRQRYRRMARRPREEALDENLVRYEDTSSAWTADDIHRALNALPELQRRALVMRELEGRSYADIAGALELTDSALQTLIFRARRSIREQLQETMTCAEARRAICLRLEGELGIAGRRALRSHLRGCPACVERERRSTTGRSSLQLLLVVLPAGRVLKLLGLSGGGTGTSTGVGGAAAGKAAAILVAGALTGSVGYRVLEADIAAPSKPAARPALSRIGIPGTHRAAPTHHARTTFVQRAAFESQPLTIPAASHSRDVSAPHGVSKPAPPAADPSPAPAADVAPVAPPADPTQDGSGSAAPADPQPTQPTEATVAIAPPVDSAQPSPDPTPTPTPTDPATHGKSDAAHAGLTRKDPSSPLHPDGPAAHQTDGAPQADQTLGSAG